MKRKYERVYVKVNANFDSTGYMQPRSIMWSDGRVFNIDEVRDIGEGKSSHLSESRFGACFLRSDFVSETKETLFREPNGYMSSVFMLFVLLYI